MAYPKESWQQTRIQYLTRLRPDRLAAGASITKPRLRTNASWLNLIDHAISIALGVMLGALCALWVIWEIWG